MKFAPNMERRLTALAMPAALAAAQLALDRASVRRVDGDGHLHIQASPISKGGVSGYLGREIPDSERLGLDPDRLYQLLRDPAELAKAAPTFAGKPLVSVHRPLTASDHAHRVVVGAIGQDVRWEPPYLVAGLSVWDGAAIEGIESGAQRQLSAGYRYQALPEPGVYQGTSYDLRMVGIVGNHVSLCERGRAGPDVMVGDAALQPKRNSMANPEIDPNVRSQLLSYLGELLPKDQLDDVEAILAGRTVAAPSMAGDAAARAIGRRFVADQRVRQAADFDRRWPEARRLNR